MNHCPLSESIKLGCEMIPYRAYLIFESRNYNGTMSITIPKESKLESLCLRDQNWQNVANVN